MGISIPRPQMRATERRHTEELLRRHAEFMRRFEAEGMTRSDAQAVADAEDIKARA